MAPGIGLAVAATLEIAGIVVAAARTENPGRVGSVEIAAADAIVEIPVAVSIGDIAETPSAVGAAENSLVMDHPWPS